MNISRAQAIAESLPDTPDGLAIASYIEDLERVNAALERRITVLERLNERKEPGQ